MIGCLENNHDHEGPRAPCIRGARTPTTSRSVTGEPACHRRTPIKFEDPQCEEHAPQQPGPLDLLADPQADQRVGLLWPEHQPDCGLFVHDAVGGQTRVQKVVRLL